MSECSLLNQRLCQYPGEFECHVTVDIDDNDIDHFRAKCHHLGGSAIVIQLDRGDCPLQPMIAKLIDGTVSDPYRQIMDLYESL
ncbi:hypothetical protein N9J26_01095, partial [bacterium]|nr:hypothetical protein [bacterium]